MKKLLIVSGSLRMGGLERVLIEVLQNLAKDRYQITLAIHDDAGADNVFLSEVPSDVTLRFFHSQEHFQRGEKLKYGKKTLNRKLKYNFFLFQSRGRVKKQFTQLVKQEEYDLIIDFDGGLSKAIHSYKGVKAIWIHNSVTQLLKKKNKIKRFGKRLGNYDHIVAICDEMKMELSNLFPKLQNRILRLYNPFSIERIKRLSDEKEGLGIEQKNWIQERYCLAVSRLDMVQKDYITLLLAFQKFHARVVSDLKLYIIGEGPDRSEIEELIVEMKLQDKVRLLGLQTNPYLWMKQAHVFLHSSKYEGLPTVLIEALLLGKKVISSDCQTGPREILDNGKKGHLFNVGDSDTLSRYIEEANMSVCDSDEYARYALKFSTAVVMAAYNDAIDSWIETGKGK